jgi:hypothetical protein
VLTLIRSMLRMINIMISVENVHLYEQKLGGLRYDVDRPDGPIRPDIAAMMASRPDID